MFNLAAHRKDRTVATIAAFILLLQALFASLAIAGGPSDAALDAFGNRLCIANPDATGDNTDRNAHPALPDCCTASCSMFAPVVADDRSRSLFSVPLPASASLAWALSGDHFAVPALLRGPGSPRAPPFAV
ncbi:hypothetical protein BCL74_0079 [Oceanibaculum indicum]|uniref:DUF2946 family protein n=1 Tax=Oceanibaculum indicum TaxID=526216 RepID=A0A420WN48_9PROT|nr:hypothetical protein BCL74_0079 [Oceanibaculum indicum]